MKFILIKEETFQRSQSVDNIRNFYKSGRAWRDSAMVEHELHEYNESIQQEAANTYIRFAKVLWFLRGCPNTLALEIQGLATISTGGKYHICKEKD